MNFLYCKITDLEKIEKNPYENFKNWIFQLNKKNILNKLIECEKREGNGLENTLFALKLLLNDESTQTKLVEMKINEGIDKYIRNVDIDNERDEETVSIYREIKNKAFENFILNLEKDNIIIEFGNREVEFKLESILDELNVLLTNKAVLEELRKKGMDEKIKEYINIVQKESTVRDDREEILEQCDVILKKCNKNL